ncbi:MAG: diacylglycerol kinase family protein [Pseudomonadota bacterium]
MTPQERPNILVIFNPTAGARRRRRLRRFLAACAEGGAKVELHQTTGPGDARQVASHAAAQSYDTIVAAGGDGTINETINGLMQSSGGRPPALGILALGTANVLAAELALPRNPERAAAIVLSGARRRVQLGVANGRHFALMAGVGFDAAVVATVDPVWKKRLRQGAYVLSCLQLLLRYRFPHYQVTVDGETFTARSLIACKARHYGGPFVLAPSANMEDPSLQLCIFERAGPVTAARFGIALLRGKLHSARGVRLLQAAEVRVEGPDGDPVQGDGELVAELPLLLSIAQSGLDVLVPGQQAPALRQAA